MTQSREAPGPASSQHFHTGIRTPYVTSVLVRLATTWAMLALIHGKPLGAPQAPWSIVLLIVGVVVFVASASWTFRLVTSPSHSVPSDHGTRRASRTWCQQVPLALLVFEWAGYAVSGIFPEPLRPTIFLAVAIARTIMFGVELAVRSRIASAAAMEGRELSPPATAPATPPR